MIKRLFTLAIAAGFLLLALASLTSASYYVYNSGGYGNDYYDSYSSYTSRTSGFGPFITTKTTNYDRVKEKYWDGYDWVERTVYVKETRDSPDYYDGYRGGNYGYGYDPWYQKYWDRPNYGYGGYGSGGYGNYYSYGNYYPSYRTNW
ncbi:MAG: hypothetical protein KJ718_05240 [Nanoarchaeota archaeon]|nr:hypothetical protein [Nanoarchaeota archaeon]MBU1051930.1 hypothetical protein [Nanoarchaeota archaeon]MBU1988328.1 hypothetical protein [Nanoarchaeota archaeon]